MILKEMLRGFELTIFLVLGFFSVAHAQVATDSFFIHDQYKSILVVLDSVAKNNLRFKQTKGFRILLYNGNNRALAVKSKEQAYKEFPEAEITFQYTSPNFKVKFGNYTSKIEAIQNLKDMKAYFVDAILIPDLVILR
jgi:hypothetical protein